MTHLHTYTLLAHDILIYIYVYMYLCICIYLHVNIFIYFYNDNIFSLLIQVKKNGLHTTYEANMGYTCKNRVNKQTDLSFNERSLIACHIIVIVIITPAPELV